MKESEEVRGAVDRFLLEHIDTVPHLEALLLLWNSRPKIWPVEEMAENLFLGPESTRVLLEDLVRQRLTFADSDGYRYEPDMATRDELMSSVDEMYRRELVRVSRLIHSKPSAAVREFARAFRLKKDRE